MTKHEQIAAAMMGIYARTDPNYLSQISKEMRVVEGAIDSSVLIDIGPNPKVTGYIRMKGDSWWKRADVPRFAAMVKSVKSLDPSE